LDLWAANRRWLSDAGVRRIETAALCTACRVDEFYSYRAEKGRTGHFGAVMAIRG
jgi:copper oxidase (laccase) domain-containing protein